MIGISNQTNVTNYYLRLCTRVLSDYEAVGGHLQVQLDAIEIVVHRCVFTTPAVLILHFYVIAYFDSLPV